MIRKLVGLLILLLLVSLALPTLLNAIQALIPALFISTVFVGIGILLFQRRRRW